LKIAVTSAGLVLAKALRGEVRCRVRARLHSGLVVRAEAMNGRIQAALSRSTARLALHVAAALDGHGGRQPAALAPRHRGSAG
jgi:hypothetical protein